MKHGTEFCKDLENLFSERADLEKDYVNGLHKLTKKARKATKRCIGSLEVAWQRMIAELEAEEEVHRSLSASLSQDCAKVMKGFTETQIKQREPVEATVEKQYKAYMDKYNKQLKYKKIAHKHCRDLETNWELLEEVKNGRGKPMTEKDIHKLEKTCRKMEESLIKADRDYRDSNLKTEEARLSWEAAMYKCCQTNEALEQERLQQVQNMLIKYCQLVETIIRPTEENCEGLMHAAGEISPEADIEVACTNLGTGPNQPEQLLLDCYEEEFQNPMNTMRRRANLEKKVQAIEEEIARQEKARQGVESLFKVYQEQPDFCDEKGAEDANRQLVESDSFLNMLKANHFKLLCAHAEISKAPRPTSQFSDFIQTGKDKQGQPMSILRIPVEQIAELQQEPLREYTALDPDAYSNPVKKRGTKKGSYGAPPRYEDAQQYPSNGAVGGFQPEESDDYPDMQGKEDGTLQFDEQYQGDYQCE